MKYPIGLLEEELKNKVVRTLCVLRDLRVRFNSPRRRVPFVTRGANSGGTTPNTSILHDAFGNITNATDTAGNSWQFSYASLNILTNEVFTSLRLCDSACQTNALSRLIDAYSRPAGYDLAINNTPRSRVRYGYDVEGHIATLAATNAANRGFQVAYINEGGYNYGYELTTPSGAILRRTVTRDPYRRSLTLDCTTRFNSVEVASFAYSFDAHNRPISRNNDRFAYNDRDEILSAMIGTNRIEHAYDTIGNHVFCAFNSATNFYANNQLNQTTASYLCAPSSVSDDATPQDAVTPPLFDGYDILSTNKFTWSAQGGLQRDGRFVYAFDAEDQLTSVTSSHLTNGAIRVENKYDYRHRRISKTVKVMVDDTPPDSPGAPPLPATHQSWHLKERHDFVYDDWNLIHETITTVDANSATNVTEIEYFWGPDLSNTLQGAGGVGGLLAVSMNGAFYFQVYDNLGNIVKYLDENGTIVASYAFDDFGRILSVSSCMSNIFAFLFSTKYFDSETGVCYYGYRFYSPLLHSWFNRDPHGERHCGNLNLFCLNLPTSVVDYLGQFSVMITAGPIPLTDVLPNDQIQLFNEYRQLKEKLLASCPSGNVGVISNWDEIEPICCRDSCLQQATKIADEIVREVRRRQSALSGWFGNAMSWSGPEVASGCVDWQLYIQQAIHRALRDVDKKRRCFKFAEGHHLYFDANILSFEHNWSKILLPGVGSAKLGDSSKEIEIDPWRTGGKNLFKK